jgi:hypothetical protein
VLVPTWLVAWVRMHPRETAVPAPRSRRSTKLCLNWHCSFLC